MATSTTEIANFALAELGSKRITNIDDTTSKNARIAKLHYDQARKEVLRSGHWNFAIRPKVLSAAADAPVHGWSYQYPLPRDFIRLTTVNNVSVIGTNVEEWFKIQRGIDSDENDLGTCLLTELGEVWIEYVSDVSDVTRFDPLYTDALAILLAAKCCRSITGSDKRVRELRAQYEELTLPEAQLVDATETSSNENNLLVTAMNRSPFVNSRNAFGQNGPLPSAPSTTTEEDSGCGIGSFTVG